MWLKYWTVYRPPNSKRLQAGIFQLLKLFFQPIRRSHFKSSGARLGDSLRGTYSSDYPPSDRVGPQVVQDGRLLIAGEAFPVPPRHNGWVDGAAMSGLHAAEIILNKIDSSTNWFTIPQRIWAEKD
ncbi:hypothetical protein IV203_032082 [Nitzschia inconspicua]|uniref:Uncharacterized protein n=1 Tax=Nitzschia inconspicua TaxID=303405 RepID=A0A9K3PAL5_9STRA|nr:hypothetical protein IV203_011278 [Nitzschia inconspicua]KAG7369339.1 hypothetical protein IV203_032082 [Nitzschia inconspicua]